MFGGRASTTADPGTASTKPASQGTMSQWMPCMNIALGAVDTRKPWTDGAGHFPHRPLRGAMTAPRRRPTRIHPGFTQDSFGATRTLGPRGTFASGSTARTTRRPTGTATTTRTATATAIFRTTRWTAPWGPAGSGPAGPATLSPHLLGKLHQFIAVELPVAVGVK